MESEKEEQAPAEQAPIVGKDSAAGWRWFASARYPSQRITIIPAQDKTDNSPPVRGVYFDLLTFPKPDHFRAPEGGGLVGDRDQTGTDRNDNPKWGIKAIYDPGPEPEAGYVSDALSVPRKDRRTKVQKELLRKTIDILRQTKFYFSTQQDNLIDRLMELKELTWDPTPLSGRMVGFVRHGSAKLGKADAEQAARDAVAPPENKPTPMARPKVPHLGPGGQVMAVR